MTDYKKYINALRKCAKEYENDRTFTGHIIVADLCRDFANLLEELEQKPCEMTAEEYRQRMIQAFHNADTDELIAICVLPTEKEFEHLEWLLKNHYKKEPCEDAISRSGIIAKIEDEYKGYTLSEQYAPQDFINLIEDMPPVTPAEKVRHCKDCKYFEYDSKIDGLPFIVAHEICSRWGNGCKTREDGYCFLFEPKMQEVGSE